MFTERKNIVAAARGDILMDLVIQNAKLVNVFTAEVYRADIGIKEGRFAAIAPYDSDKPQFTMKGEAERDVEGMYMIPGFVDAHVHIESTMLTPENFAKALLRYGTSTAVIDPHEIANVLGVDGVKQMVAATEGLPLRVLTTIPSCVPATETLETAGARFYAKEVEELLQLPSVVGIAEIMDYPAVIKQNKRMAEIVQVGLNNNVLNEGHAPRVFGRDSNAYLAAGIHSDHESRSADEILEKLRLGSMIYIRESSVSKFADVAAEALKEVPLAINVAMCTDDIEANDILHNGQMNRVVRRLIEEGVDAALAIRYASINGAKHFGLRDVGAIAPGYVADFSLLHSLEEMDINDVYVKGEKTVENGKVLIDIKSKQPLNTGNTMRIPTLTVEDFAIRAPIESGKAKLRTIEVLKNGVTEEDILEVDVIDGKVSELPDGYVFLSVTGRHGQNTKPFVGVLKGSGIKQGAYATTMAHDSHNLVIAGKSPKDMYVAAEELKAVGGGLCLVENGAVVSKVELPVAGLMSEEPIEVIAKKISDFSDQVRERGIQVGSRAPSMALTSVILTVTPHIRISDKGIVHVNEQKLVSLFLED